MAFMAFFLVCRYGTMRDNVINLQVVFPYSYIIKKLHCIGSAYKKQILIGIMQAVLPNGDVIKTGSRARKSAAGYGRHSPYC